MFSKEFKDRVDNTLFRADEFGVKETAPEVERVLTELLDDAEKNHKGTVRLAAVHDVVGLVNAGYM